MLGGKLLIVAIEGILLCGLDETAHALGVFLKIHICLLPSPARFAAPDQIAVTNPPD
jgi:hypothetical protein